MATNNTTAILSRKDLYAIDAEVNFLLEQKSEIDKKIKNARTKIENHLNEVGEEEVEVNDKVYYVATSSYGFKTTNDKITKKEAVHQLLYAFINNHYEEFTDIKLSPARIVEYCENATLSEKEEVDRIMLKHGLLLEKRTTIKTQKFTKSKKK